MFELINPATNIKVEIGAPDEEYESYGRFLLPENKVKISKYFKETNQKARYEYDFGDSWIHTVKFEKIIPVSAGEKYPKCITGKMACPPEDCGGIGGYYDMLSILNNPKDEEYDGMIEWLGGKYDPQLFDPNAVSFDDPLKRWNISL